MKYGSVCSGVGTDHLSWAPLGWETEFFAEIDDFCAELLKVRFPGVPNLGDFTKIKAKDYYGKLDLFVGGTPCQGFSLAGLRKGMADDRSGLAGRFIDFIRIARPRWVLWENVPGVLSSWSGSPEDEAIDEWEQTHDFDQFCQGIQECGYGYAWRILDAQYVRVSPSYEYAVPQRRRRIFLVAYFGNWRPAAAVLFDRESLSGHPAPCREARSGVARSVTASIGGCSGKEQQQSFVGGNGRPLNALSIQGEIADGRRQGQNGFGINADGAAHTLNTLAVNAVAYDCHNGIETGQVGQTITTGHDCEKMPVVVVNAVCYDGRGYGGESAATSLNGDHPERVSDFSPIIMSTGQGNAEINSEFPPTLNCDHEAPIVMSFGWNKSSSMEMRVSNETSEVLRASRCSEPAVAIVGTPICCFTHNDGGRDCTENLAPTLRSGGEGGVVNSAIATTGVVRRLTPLECERLMGYPDFHTMIPWKVSKSLDATNPPPHLVLSEDYQYLRSHGFSHEDSVILSFTPDSRRYKACGNGIAANVLSWIGTRIQLVEELMNQNGKNENDNL